MNIHVITLLSSVIVLRAFEGMAISLDNFKSNAIQYLLILNVAIFKYAKILNASNSFKLCSFFYLSTLLIFT